MVRGWTTKLLCRRYQADELHEARSVLSRSRESVRSGVQGLQARPGLAHTQRGGHARRELPVLLLFSRFFFFMFQRFPWDLLCFCF